ncbi:putative E3 ubiquitin ligase protein [Dioscorea alata]|uniref:E3 ubiquitin ligase protein n=1 Tax=Dioscorea alata TaxID=55571 RepID=A0ACB7TWK4_DIOAL|nr:putative E3 ubiquitin ligase protein [Dioscorea alata]
MAESSTRAGWEALFDVEELPWEVNGARVFDLVHGGNLAFREKRFEDAIKCYSKAQLLEPGNPIILSNRCSAFCRISQFLRDRSALESECQPLNGLDPTTHAELALKDAERVISLRMISPKSYFLKTSALILLERYEEAHEAVLSGLQVDPFSHHLESCLRDLERISAGSVKRAKQWKPQLTDDFECTLCLKLLYEPVTTPCGHSFCRSCLLQSMDHGNKCPMCRTVLFIGPRTYPISVTLNNIIQKTFPVEYAERKSEQQCLSHLDVDIMPLFVMDVVLPCQKLSLNIFEPRYRLMVRRIMEGNHRMGMVGVDPATGSISNYACEVEVSECEPLPDGRFYLEVQGHRRFRISRSWDQDGYRVAEVDWIQDIQTTVGTRERHDLQQVATAAADLARSLIRRAREAARNGRRSRRLELLQAEGMPGPQDPERFSFWLVSHLNLRPSEKLELIRMRDTHERISRGLIFLRAEGENCQVQ